MSINPSTSLDTYVVLHVTSRGCIQQQYFSDCLLLLASSFREWLTDNKSLNDVGGQGCWYNSGFRVTVSQNPFTHPQWWDPGCLQICPQIRSIRMHSPIHTLHLGGLQSSHSVKTLVPGLKGVWGCFFTLQHSCLKMLNLGKAWAADFKG